MRAALAIAVVLALLAAPGAAAAPYEPNDSLPSATGPLASGQTLAATVEATADRDYFSFYVTSSTPAGVQISVHNSGGGTPLSDIDAMLLDAAGTPITGQAFIGDGSAAKLVAELGPQKYYLEVSAGEGFGDSYELSLTNAGGTIGPYAQIASRCTRATAKVKAAKTGLQRAQSNLQRATARLRRSRFATPGAKKSTRSAHRKAKAAVRNAEQALKKAKVSGEPWCSIAP